MINQPITHWAYIYSKALALGILEHPFSSFFRSLSVVNVASTFMELTVSVEILEMEASGKKKKGS
jgi:hypothetical protein